MGWGEAVAAGNSNSWDPSGAAYLTRPHAPGLLSNRWKPRHLPEPSQPGPPPGSSGVSPPTSITLLSMHPPHRLPADLRGLHPLSGPPIWARSPLPAPPAARGLPKPMAASSLGFRPLPGTQGDRVKTGSLPPALLHCCHVHSPPRHKQAQLLLAIPRASLPLLLVPPTQPPPGAFPDPYTTPGPQSSLLKQPPHVAVTKPHSWEPSLAKAPGGHGLQ